MKHRSPLLCVLLLCAMPLHARQWFVATTGSDTTGTGAPDLPFLSIPRAQTAMSAGDTIVVAGGVYKVTATITISKSGSLSAPMVLTAAPGARAILDCSSMPFNSSNRGIKFQASYWHVKGLDVKGAGDNGMYLTGSNNIIENCAFYENQDTGLQLGGGASHNRIVNCDSYFNRDPGQGNADGFSPKLD
ncbi:MAG TPA: right-handed parallel beta-helix repeat-containing protein, partial [Bacteroidota bacterium]